MGATEDLNLIFKSIIDTVDDLRDSNRLEVLGDKASEIIRERTRKGLGVRPTTKRRFKLPALSKSYKDFRQRYRALLHPETDVNKSNLTLSGQMLDSIGIKIRANDTVIIGPKGPRLPFLPGQKRPPSNEVVAGFAEFGERPFITMSQKDQRILVDFYEKVFDSLLKRKKL